MDAVERKFKVVKTAEPPVVQQETTHLPGIGASYLFAGNAHFTVSNGEKIYAYRVRYVNNTRLRGERGYFFLSVRTSGGPYSFRYVGVPKRDGRLVATGKSEFVKGTPEFDVAEWAIRKVVSGEQIPIQYDIRHDGKCGVCRKVLVDEYDIDAGVHSPCLVSLVQDGV